MNFPGFPGFMSTIPYTVIEGDTCKTIAFFFAIDAQELLSDNPVINARCSNLKVGQILKLKPSVISVAYYSQMQKSSTSTSTTPTKPAFAAHVTETDNEESTEDIPVLPVSQTRKPAQENRDSSSYRYVCYFPTWSHLQPERIDPFLCTHIVFTYLTIQSLKVTPGSTFDEAVMSRLLSLREKNPNLKLLIGVVGIILIF
jgi:hypothetical protein